MYSMVPAVVQPRNARMVVHVVQRSQHRPRHHQQQDCKDVARHEVEGEQMDILTHHELDWVDIECIQAPSRRRDLLVVMFVDVGIDGLPVEEPMESGVEEIKYHNHWEEYQYTVTEGRIIGVPTDGRRQRQQPEKVVGEAHDRDPVHGYV